MATVGLTDVDKREHHHDERLQHNDQNVEKPPDQPSGDLAESGTRSPDGPEFESEAPQQGKKEEQQLAGVHVAEKSHAQRNELGQIFNQVQKKIERPKQRVLAERSRKEFHDEARRALGAG